MAGSACSLFQYGCSCLTLELPNLILLSCLTRSWPLRCGCQLPTPSSFVAVPPFALRIVDDTSAALHLSLGLLGPEQLIDSRVYELRPRLKGEKMALLLDVCDISELLPAVHSASGRGADAGVQRGAVGRGATAGGSRRARYEGGGEGEGGDPEDCASEVSTRGGQVSDAGGGVGGQVIAVRDRYLYTAGGAPCRVRVGIQSGLLFELSDRMCSDASRSDGSGSSP